MGGCSTKPLTDEHDLKEPSPISKPDEEIQEFGGDEEEGEEEEEEEEEGKYEAVFSHKNMVKSNGSRSLKSLFVQHKLEDHDSIGTVPTLQQLLRHPLDSKYVQEFKDLGTEEVPKCLTTQLKAKPDQFSSTKTVMEEACESLQNRKPLQCIHEPSKEEMERVSQIKADIENPEMVKKSRHRIMYEPEPEKFKDIPSGNTDMEEASNQPTFITGPQPRKLNSSETSVGEPSEFNFDVKLGNVEDVSSLVQDHVQVCSGRTSAIQVVMVKRELSEASMQLSDVEIGENHAQECAAVVGVMKHFEYGNTGNLPGDILSREVSTQLCQVSDTEQRAGEDDGIIGMYSGLDPSICSTSTTASDQPISCEPLKCEGFQAQSEISNVQCQSLDNELESPNITFDMQNESHAEGVSGEIINEELEGERKFEVKSDEINNKQTNEELEGERKIEVKSDEINNKQTNEELEGERKIEVKSDEINNKQTIEGCGDIFCCKNNKLDVHNGSKIFSSKDSPQAMDDETTKHLRVDVVIQEAKLDD